MRKAHAGSLLALCLGTFLALPALAGESDDVDLELLVATIEANKKALVAVNLALDDAKAKAFWPVYDRYEAELSGLNDRFAAIVDEYTRSFGSMTDEQARRLVKDYLEVERERAELRQRYLEPFAEALPGRTLARFYQIENKIQAVVRFELARTIPVIDE